MDLHGGVHRIVQFIEGDVGGEFVSIGFYFYALYIFFGQL